MKKSFNKNNINIINIIQKKTYADIIVPESKSNNNYNYYKSCSLKDSSIDELKILKKANIHKFSSKIYSKDNANFSIKLEKLNRFPRQKYTSIPHRKKNSNKSKTNKLNRKKITRNNFYFLFIFFCLLVIITIFNLKQRIVTYNYKRYEQKNKVISIVSKGGNVGSVPMIYPMPFLKNGDGKAYVTNIANECWGNYWCNQKDGSKFTSTTIITEDTIVFPKYEWDESIEYIKLDIDGKSLKCTGYQMSQNCYVEDYCYVEDGELEIEEETSQGVKKYKSKYGDILNSFPRIEEIKYKGNKDINKSQNERYIMAFKCFQRGIKYVIADKGDELSRAFEYGNKKSDLGDQMGFPSVECTKDNFMYWLLPKSKEAIKITDTIERHYKEVLEPVTKESINLASSKLGSKDVLRILYNSNQGMKTNMSPKDGIYELLVVVKDDTPIYYAPDGKLLNESIKKYQGDVGHIGDSSVKYIGLEWQ